MALRALISRITFTVILSLGCLIAGAHDIYFCGEKIPLDDRLVADKLMNIIKRQINGINLPSLRQRINIYMPRVEKYLQDANLPQDFKYLAIVESAFTLDALSRVGAKGFWQLMPRTARDWGLIVNETVDERTDFEKSTLAACREIARNYATLKKLSNVSSWVLTAAAYNFGSGNIKKAITKQGPNYFSMHLNPETAVYVYKIIAVKELFEYPELYMKNFGYNIFTTASSSVPKGLLNTADTDVSSFSSMKVDVNEADGSHPADLKERYVLKTSSVNKSAKVTYITGRINDKYKNLKDNDLISIVLDNNLEVGSRFHGKGNPIQGRAWIIDGRVMIDLGYEHRVILYDTDAQKGVSLSKLKSKKPAIILKVTDRK